MGSEHTPPLVRPGRGAKIIERKRKPDGTVREYPCTLEFRSQTVTIIRFVMAKGGTIVGLPVEVPPGSVSDGYFWPRRTYNLYRMKHADGSIIVHRFDAVADVRVSDAAVDYRDLVLDWWALPDGTLIEEDRDEMEALLADGKMSKIDAKRANQAARDVFSRYRHIIDEAEALERRWVRD
jgi:predicted RNA-binding protein associated with RNAse of E/G family